MDGKRLGKDCFHGYGPTEIFWREGEFFLGFFLMVIGDWNCHYRHSTLRWKKDVELELYPKVFIIIIIRLFPSKQNRKTVKMYLLV